MIRRPTPHRTPRLVGVIAAAGAALVLMSFVASSVAEARCGSRGGPGYRKADGKCASHRD